jgi:integrase
MACVRKYRGHWVVDWRDPITRKRAIEAVEEDSREAAKRRLAEILKTGEQVGSKATFKEYGDWWLENCANGTIKDSTYQEYEAVLKNHVYPLLGSKPFAKVNRAMIRELIAAKKKEGFSQSTIRNIMAPVRGMFFQAIEDGAAHQNPAARIGKLNKRSKNPIQRCPQCSTEYDSSVSVCAKDGKSLEPVGEINPLTREEIQTVLQTATGGKYLHHYPLFLCAPRTGIRQGELVALKGIDVDFNSGLIHVQRNLSRGKITLPKNGKTRKVDMSAQLAEVLNELLSKRSADALRREMEKPADKRQDAATVVNEVMEGWLFQTPVGTQIDPSNLRKLFNRLLTDAKLRRIRFHDLRHTFASLLLQNSESPAYVKEQMGHSSIQVTVDIYGHLVPGGNRQAVDRLDDASASTKKVAVA